MKPTFSNKIPKYISTHIKGNHSHVSHSQLPNHCHKREASHAADSQGHRGTTTSLALWPLYHAPQRPSLLNSYIVQPSKPILDTFPLHSFLLGTIPIHSYNDWGLGWVAFFLNLNPSRRDQRNTCVGIPVEIPPGFLTLTRLQHTKAFPEKIIQDLKEFIIKILGLQAAEE